MSRPFHHGNLRAVLLEQAEAMLQTVGVDGLSLRELARQAGVSHGAPRSHFIDRQALLDALAEQGFTRLTERVVDALRSTGTFEQRFRLVGHAYVDYAIEHSALMDIMFSAKAAGASADVTRAAGRLFAVLDEALEASPGNEADDGRLRFKLAFAAVMQGTATLVVSRRISHTQADTLVDDASDMLMHSALGHAVLPPP